jgi:hypothetical protein
MSGKKKPSELYPRVAECEKRLNDLIRETINIGKEMLSVDERIYTSDIFLMGVMNRSINLMDAILVLTDRWNFVAAGPLTRVHLDTLLRMSYWKTLRNDKDFLRRMLDGEQINNIRDKEGRKLTEARLRDYTRSIFPQVDNVYNETSRLIHFSNKHMFTCIESLDDSGRKVKFSIGRGSSGAARWGEEDILILLECIIAITDGILAVGREWVKEKAQMSKPVNELK